MRATSASDAAAAGDSPARLATWVTLLRAALRRCVMAPVSPPPPPTRKRSQPREETIQQHAAPCLGVAPVVKKRRATAEEQEQQQEQEQEQEQPTLEEQQLDGAPEGELFLVEVKTRDELLASADAAAEAQTLRELLQLKAQHLQQQQHAAEDADVAWGREFAALDSLRRLAQHHQDQARQLLEDGALLTLVLPAASSLRSAVARNALLCVQDLVLGLKAETAARFDDVVPVLLNRACSEKQFLRDLARHVLDTALAAGKDEQFLRPLLATSTAEKNAQAGLYVTKCVIRMDRELLRTFVLETRGSFFDEMAAFLNCKVVECKAATRRSCQHTRRVLGNEAFVALVKEKLSGTAQLDVLKASEIRKTPKPGHAKSGIRERMLQMKKQQQQQKKVQSGGNDISVVVVAPPRSRLWPSIRSRPRASLSLSKCSPVPAPVMARRPSHQRIRRDSLQLQRDGSGGASFYGYVNELRNAFDPHSGLLKSWHQILFGCLLYEAFLLPFASTFAVKFALPTSTVAFRAFYAAEVLFLADFYVKLNTGFYEAGNIHRDTRKVRAKYLKSFGFLLDVVAIIPLSIILPTPMVPVPSTTSETACWPGWYEFHKVLRVWRLPGYFSNLDDVYAKYFRALKLFKVLVATAFVAHFIACCRFAMGWKSGVADASNPWLPSAALGSKPLATQYVGALFWSVGLLTGSFEGALPRGNTEFAFTLAAVLLGFMLFIYSSATLFMLSKSESNQTVLAQARINQLRHLLTFHHVPESLQVQAVEYLKRHYTDAESNDREVVKLLCPSITKDIQVELLKDMVGRIPLFRDCNQQFIVALTSLLEMTSFPAHVTLFEAGDRGDYIFTYVEGFGSTSDNEHPWLPSSELELRRYVDPNGVPYYTGGSTNVSLTDAEVRNIASMQYMRSLYFGATMLTTLGKTVEPSSALQYSATLVLMLCGFFSLALMIDSVQKRLTASAFEQKEFLVTRTRVQQFINSQTAPTAVHQRAKSFLEFWWSCHRGAIASELLSELPEAIKRPVVRSMCQPALRTLSLLADVRPCLDALEQVFIDNIRFILYGQGEIIYRQGDYASGLFFLLEGELIVIVNGGMPRTLVKGGFIGTAALNLSETSVSYAERVTAASGCILIFISRENLNGMHKVFPSFSMALRALEKRLEGAKLPRAQHDYNSTRERSSSGALRPMPVSKPLTYEMKVLRYLDLDDVIFDPDENIAAVWELWTFCLIIALYLKVVEDITTGVESSHVINSEVVAVIIEIFFALDFYFQSRLGYYEYGNKIMDLVAIRKRFFRSHRCYCAALALFPLYVVNWMLGSAHRYELFSVNKLLRLFRAPIIFAKLESKYLNRTVQLRLAKLVIVSLVMSHLFGCIWLNFKDPGFQNAWMPSPSLTKADPGTQYSALLFWSFGIMSHSNSGELPKSVEQCFFTVVVLLGGAFLFAFVIGNISDVVELVDADSREFNAKLSCLRLLLGHFHLPLAIEEQLKTYFFFQRYHTITQEYLLERCLPPSLLTEIRLVHLQPMIVKVGFLAGMEGSVTRMLVAQFVQALTVKDQYVFRLGEEGSDMFFVFTGIVEVLVPLETLQRRQSNDMKLFSLGSPSRSSFRTVFPTLDPSKLQAKGQLKKVNELTSGSYFGEVSLFTSKPRSAHARSKTSCVLYKLSRRSLELVFERYPDWKRKVLKIVNIQQEQQLLRNLYMEEQLDIAANTTKNMLNHVDVLGDSANIGQANNDRNRSMRSSVGSFSERTTSGPLRQRNTSTRPVGITALKSAGSFFSSYKAQRSASTNMAVLQISSRKKSVLWVDMLLQCTDAQSAFHIQWLKIIAASTIYMALAIPYRNSFDALERLGPFPIAARVIELTCEVLFGWDIWVHWNLKDGLESMELYESKQRDAYQKERLWIDIVAAIPIDHFLSDFYQSPLLCMNRCLKLFNFPHYMKEINRRSVAYEKYRFWTLWVLFFVLLHWCACAYFSLASATVSSDTAGSESCWDNWSPPRSALSISWTDPSLDLLMLRFLRGLFFASTAFIKKGKVFEPSDHTDYLFTLFVDFVGLVTMAFMIGEMANLYISYISNEVEFRKNHIAVELYLERWHITGKLRARCHAFLSSLWSSHRGVNYQAIFDEIPLVIRTESILHIANLPLRAFINSVFRPFATAHPHDRDVEALTRSIAQHLKYEGYPRDECVLVEGRVSNEMYFVVKGHLIATTSADRPEHSIRSDQHYKKGDFFGEHGLLGYSVGVCTVKTVCACDLLSLSSESLLEVILSRPIFQAALSIAVEGYRELYKRTRLMDATSTKEDTASAENDWGVELFRILDARRKLWLDEALAFKAADSDSDGPVNEPWTVSCFKPGQEMGLVTISTPSSCMKVFEKLIRLIATRGTLDMKHLQSATQFQETLPIMAADLNTHRSNLSMTEKSDSSKRSSHRKPYI
ncbi:Voltage-gated Ion Channel (VIC) Superfamily [Phytophthora cinnamomi]|uniref:Voltage-gated Ion Channel (VIC) Superfamily n=1 Tax=Phytophthora cinnamomi TaxID=4785 RepID=UPI00355969F7|nr:Voltage-gated Ion Channel (VIC) Superfamily [Phytophthora cinnamomi]